jgi:hypothetical protein
MGQILCLAMILAAAVLYKFLPQSPSTSKCMGM